MKYFLEIIAPWLGLAGFVLSLINLYMAWKDRQVRCDVRLRLYMSPTSYPLGFQDVPAERPVLSVIVVNQGKTPVWLVDVEFRVKKLSWIQYSHQFCTSNGQLLGDFHEGVKIESHSRIVLLTNLTYQIIGGAGDHNTPIWIYAKAVLATGKKFKSATLFTTVKEMVWRTPLAH